jgi:hypothetical protein
LRWTCNGSPAWRVLAYRPFGYHRPFDGTAVLQLILFRSPDSLL